MVEFDFDIRPYFPQPVIRVTSDLLPHTFRGNRHQTLDAQSRMSKIIDTMGQLSGVAQILTKPVTTAQKLSTIHNQTVYLQADVDIGEYGTVVGLLKIGNKDLYLFDESGQNHKVTDAPCILDFYVHESLQRTGHGKNLFETMLTEKHWKALQFSVDRPSEKLLNFMKKHYGLNQIIPQANNFVIYEGFFDANSDIVEGDRTNRKRVQQMCTSSSTTQLTQIGRYAARPQMNSVAELLQNI